MTHHHGDIDAEFPAVIDQASRRELRKSLRKSRRSLTLLQQKQASRALTRQLLKHPQVIRSRHIALYLANDGEIDPAIFAAEARRHGKVCYLPVLHPVLHNRLWFVRYDSEAELLLNQFGIPEPAIKRGSRRPVRALDLVLLPLVGFDVAGGRLGMGGGFYDRTFAFKRAGTYSPFLMGLAHECQKVESLPIASWDVPLDGVVTDRYSYRFDRASASSTPKPAVDRLFIGRYRTQGSARRFRSSRS